MKSKYYTWNEKVAKLGYTVWKVTPSGDVFVACKHGAGRFVKSSFHAHYFPGRTPQISYKLARRIVPTAFKKLCPKKSN